MRLLADREAALPAVGIQAVVKGEVARAVRRDLEGGGLAGHDALLDAQLVHREAMLVVFRLQEQTRRLALLYIDDGRPPARLRGHDLARSLCRRRVRYRRPESHEKSQDRPPETPGPHT